MDLQLPIAVWNRAPRHAITVATVDSFTGCSAATGDANGLLLLWRKAEVTALCYLHSSPLQLLAFARDEEAQDVVVSGDSGGTLAVWDAADGRCLHTVETSFELGRHHAPPVWCTFAAQRWLLLHHAAGSLAVVEAATLTVAQEMPVESRGGGRQQADVVAMAEVESDGHIVVLSSAGEAWVWSWQPDTRVLQREQRFLLDLPTAAGPLVAAAAHGGRLVLALAQAVAVAEWKVLAEELPRGSHSRSRSVTWVDVPNTSERIVHADIGEEGEGATVLVQAASGAVLTLAVDSGEWATVASASGSHTGCHACWVQNKRKEQPWACVWWNSDDSSGRLEWHDHTAAALSGAGFDDLAAGCTASIVLGPTRLPALAPAAVPHQAPDKAAAAAAGRFGHTLVTGPLADSESSDDDSDDDDLLSKAAAGPSSSPAIIAVGCNDGVIKGDSAAPALRVRGFQDGSLVADVLPSDTQPAMLPPLATAAAAAAPITALGGLSRRLSLQS